MSNHPRVKISALGTYVPPRLLTNADLEKMVDTTDDWIMSRVGIKERHIVDKGIATSDLAAEAARNALAMNGRSANDLDAIIVATVTPSAAVAPVSAAPWSWTPRLRPRGRRRRAWRCRRASGPRSRTLQT